MSVRKVDFECVETAVLFFAFCGPKFTKFGRHVREWLQFATPLSDRRYLGDVRDHVANFPKSCRNFGFWAANFLGVGEGPPNFWPSFINYSHHRTCGKVLWRSAQRPPRLGGEKSMIETPAAFYYGRRPAIACWRP